MNTLANIYELPSATTLALLNIEPSLPLPDTFEGPHLCHATTDRYREALCDIPGIMPLFQRLRLDLQPHNDARGYLIVNGVPFGRGTMAVASALSSLVGMPKRPTHALWQEFGVDSRVLPGHPEGMGAQPLHIDESGNDPPEYTLFYSHRKDYRNGGKLVVSNVQQMVDQLTSSEREYLQQPYFSWSAPTQEASGHIGQPVLSHQKNGLWQLRHTGNLPYIIEGEPLHTDLFKKIGQLLCEQQESFVAEKGSLVFIQQQLLAHGREQLGDGQQNVPAELQRLVYHSYAVADPTL
jgi:hypothetical protein